MWQHVLPPFKESEMYYTEKDIDSTCRAFSKDWDKLSAKEKALVRQEAVKWLNAYQEACPGMFAEKVYEVK